MIVRMLINITGSRNGVPNPGVGETLEVEDHEGADLIAQGYAVEDDGESTGTVHGESTVPVGFDVADHNVDEVLEYVGDDRELAQTVLDTETAGKDRKGIVDPLTELLAD